MIGIKTIRHGQRVALWDYRGRIKYVDGPKRMFLFRQTVQTLPRFSAEADESLVVRFKDGHAEHRRGPAEIWLDPVNHESIMIEKALPIDAHEAIVVYCRDNGDVSRRVLYGPAQYVPTENEWLHEFRWHGADHKNPEVKKPRALQFRKLRVIPDQMYFDVTDVRTADDALLKIKLMVFFELVDITTMLDQTHDPIADFINALAADVIDFASSLNFEQFKHQTDALNEMATYENLAKRAERIGYRINKVVYRGYVASDKLQLMHDDAIEARTGLKLESETEEQAQELADLKLQREAQRAQKQQDMERLETEHAQRLKQLNHEQVLRQAKAEQEQAATTQREDNAIELEHTRLKNEEQAGYLKSIREMQVDLTRYLVAQYQHPDRLIRIDGQGREQLHLHDS